MRVFHRSPVAPPHKGQWRGALMFPLMCAWTNGWAKNRDASNSRSHRAHYNVIVKCFRCLNRQLLRSNTKFWLHMLVEFSQISITEIQIPVAGILEMLRGKWPCFLKHYKESWICIGNMGVQIYVFKSLRILCQRQSEINLTIWVFISTC